MNSIFSGASLKLPSRKRGHVFLLPEKGVSFTISLLFHACLLVYMMPCAFRNGSPQGVREVIGSEYYRSETQFRQRLIFVSVGDEPAKLPVERNESSQDDQLVELDDITPRSMHAPHEEEQGSAEYPYLSTKNPEGVSSDNNVNVYISAIRAAIEKHWHYREEEGHCVLNVNQSEGGAVVNASVSDCTFPEEVMRSLESAALMAQPLPYDGYEEFYSDALILKF